MENKVTPQQRYTGRKFLVAFLITLGIFGVAFLASNYFYGLRSSAIKDVESGINRQIVETEIQFQLLADAACDETSTSNNTQILQMNTLAQRLDEMEQQRGAKDPTVIALKKDYSLLMIKDYLLLREKQRRCGDDQSAIIYFYSNSGECTDCVKTGHVLTQMRKDYDKLHIYSFDYDLGLPTIETLKNIYSIDGQPPILIINRKPYYGFRTQKEIEDLMPNIEKLKAIDEDSATTTKASTTKLK